MTDGDDDDRRRARERGDVGGLAVRDGHGRVLVDEQRRGRAPDHGAATDDHCLRATQWDVVELQEREYAVGRRRHEARPAGFEESDVVRVHALDVLLRWDLVNQAGFREWEGQRRQQGDPVHRPVLPEFDQCLDRRGFVAVAGKRLDPDVDAAVLARTHQTLLICDGRRIDADREHGEPRPHAARGQRGDTVPRARVHLFRGDPLSLRVGAVDRAVEVLRERLHLAAVLDRREIDHHVHGRAAERRLGHQRADADIGHGRRGCLWQAPLARIEQPAARLRDLERHARGREQRGLHAFGPDLLLVIRRAWQFHRLRDARVGRAVVVHQPEEVGAQVVDLADVILKGLVLALLRRDARDHRCERRADRAGIGRGASAAGDRRVRCEVIAERAQRSIDESLGHGRASVRASIFPNFRRDPFHPERLRETAR